MGHKILVSTQMMIHDQVRFRKWLTGFGFEVDFLMNEQFLTENDCLKIKPIYDGWIAGDDQVTSKVIDQLKSKLKVISKWGTGIDSIDKTYAELNGVVIKNSPGAFSDAVGEMAVAYLLALTRGISITDKVVRKGGWPKEQFKTLINMKVGIIGMGAIGQGAAKRLEALGSKVSFYDPYTNVEDYEKLTVESLFSSMEAIIVTSNLNESSYHLVNQKLFDSIKHPIFLINVGRGPIVNEEDLIKAFENNKIIGAALDVYEVEPLQNNNKLLNFENIIFGSHNANNTIDAVEFVHENTINNLITHLKVNN